MPYSVITCKRKMNRIVNSIGCGSGSDVLWLKVIFNLRHDAITITDLPVNTPPLANTGQE